MANEEQLAILQEGVEVWNKWREENHQVEVDFVRADLREADLRETILDKVDLGAADLSSADLRGAGLVGANLEFADLRSANLRGASLKGSNFYGACPLYTTFGDLDLSETIGLEYVVHSGPSSIGTDTFTQSNGKIPEVFLRGCGLSDWEIEETKLYNPDLGDEEIDKILYRIHDLHASQALQISPLFISYSHADSEFVDKVGDYLTQKGIRYWRDIHKATAGPLEEQVNRAIRQNPTVLVILSKNSTKSDWVEHEVRKARETGKELGRHVLCPVTLDDSWKNSPWPERIMEQIMEYNILDFSAWRDDSKFDGMFRKLIDGLELFYKQ
jgi:hypothetical protein